MKKIFGVEIDNRLPPIYDPAKNPLLPWFFAPGGFLIGLFSFYQLLEMNFWLELRTLDECTITRNYKLNKKSTNSKLTCLEMPDETFHFKNLDGDTNETLAGLEGKTVKIQFFDGKFESHIKTINNNGVYLKGWTHLDNYWLGTFMFIFAGIVGVFGAIWIWYLRFRRN